MGSKQLGCGRRSPATLHSMPAGHPASPAPPTWRLLPGGEVHLVGGARGREALVLDQADEVKPLLEVARAAARAGCIGRRFQTCSSLQQCNSCVASKPIPASHLAGSPANPYPTPPPRRPPPASPAHKVHGPLVHHRVHHILAAGEEAGAKGGCRQAARWTRGVGQAIGGSLCRRGASRLACTPCPAAARAARRPIGNHPSPICESHTHTHIHAHTHTIHTPATK